MAYTTIDDPSAYFQALSYSGGSGSLVRTFDGNSDLQPDWTWHKSRGQTYSHYLFDSTRGVGLYLKSDSNVGDDGTSGDTTSLTSFDSNGFTLPGGSAITDGSAPIMCWAWKANGGTTSSNSDGSITSTVQANTTSGFSIVTYTGNGADTATVGHGLGSTPKMIIFKRRDSTNNWIVYHNSLTSASNFLSLNTTDAEATASNIFDDTAPTSSVFTLGFSAAVNANTSTFVAYCFAEKQGYSKFGSYTGTGNADGPMVFCGLKPAWVMIRRTDSTGSWLIWDTKRTPYNVTGTVLYANDSSAEETYSSYNLDFLSNGFKIRGTDVYTNASGGTYIYMAFAEHPFVSSEGVPTTAL
jgi:hypothetical protein